MYVRLSSAKLPALAILPVRCPAANCDTPCVKPRHYFGGLL
nr:MAG TPA: RAG1 Recombination-activating protein 1 zinc-finger domain [Caudoviricetes sp.]